MPQQNDTRLNKYIASHFSIGRRAADDLIKEGKVLVNGAPATLGARLQPHDTITINGKKLAADTPTQYMYLLVNKPINYVCSRKQQGDSPTIYSLLPAKYHHLKTVGRLDKNSSGLLLLTNDGNLAHQLTHPSFTKIKTYEVTLNEPLAPLHHQMINDIGITLPDGPSKLQLERLHEGNSTDWRVIMHEGRNRQIRRTFGALGYTVTHLHRTGIGRLTLADLQGATMREISKNIIV